MCGCVFLLLNRSTVLMFQTCYFWFLCSNAYTPLKLVRFSSNFSPSASPMVIRPAGNKVDDRFRWGNGGVRSISGRCRRCPGIGSTQPLAILVVRTRTMRVGMRRWTEVENGTKKRTAKWESYPCTTIVLLSVTGLSIGVRVVYWSPFADTRGGLVERSLLKKYKARIFQ